MKWTACRYRAQLDNLTIEVVQGSDTRWFVNIRNETLGRSIDHRDLIQFFDTAEEARSFAKIAAREILSTPEQRTLPRPTAPDAPKALRQHGAIK